MSGILAGKVWVSALDARLKPLAAALAEIASDDGGDIYPSIAYMAWLTGRSERAVQENLALLREAGVLVIIEEAHHHKTTEYLLVESALPDRPSWQESRGDKLTPLPDSGVTRVFGRGEESAPLPETGVQNSTNRGADSSNQGCSSRQSGVKQAAPKPLVVTVSKEPLEEPLEENLSLKEISLRKNYAESQKRVAR